MKQPDWTPIWIGIVVLLLCSICVMVGSPLAFTMLYGMFYSGRWSWIFSRGMVMIILSCGLPLLLALGITMLFLYRRK